jgi:hypothetical protein
MKDGVLLRGTKDEHSQVVAYLHNHSDPNLQVAGDYQSRLRKARKWCDYDAVVKHISQVSSQSLMNAENIFSALNKKQATSV